MTDQIARYMPADVDAAKEHLRTHVAQYARGTWRMERVVIVGGRGVVPSSELAMHCRIAGKEIFAAAVVYADQGREGFAPAPSNDLSAAYAYVLTIDGQIVDGLPSEVISFETSREAGATPRRHDPFEWLDGQWYITKTGWAKYPTDYRDAKDGQTRALVNGGSRGTILAAISIIEDGEHPPRVSPLPTVRTCA